MLAKKEKKKAAEAYFNNAFCIYGSKIYTLKILLRNRHFCYNGAEKLKPAKC